MKIDTFARMFTIFVFTASGYILLFDYENIFDLTITPYLCFKAFLGAVLIIFSFISLRTK